jgi:hypothetical protein
VSKLLWRAADVIALSRRSAASALCATKTELQHAVSLRGIADLARLGGDQRLMIHKRENRGFDELRLHNRRANANERFVWEYDGAFDHCVQVSGEAECL